MRNLAWVVGALGTGTVVLFACATGGLIADTPPDIEGGTGDDSSTGGDGSACPQYDITKDPKHCGSCTNACGAAQVCSMGQCKAECTAPTMKCTVDGGMSVCADFTSDTSHCGSCINACGAGDAGALMPGTGNPDSGVTIDGGYDAGPGWALGTPVCTKSTCGVTCPMGLTSCSDGICYDTSNFHDHCGDCNTACMPDTEWCNSGHCCATGTLWCGSACVDPNGDANNCGGCGHVCPMSAPQCSGGVCTTGVTYSQTLTSGSISQSDPVCTAWHTFQTALTGTYTSVTISGSNDTTGVTCTGASANSICQALHNNTTVTSVACGGRNWNVGNCSTSGYESELSADGDTCACDSAATSYIARPCIGNNNWGGIKGATCSPATQTITVTCK